MASERTLTAISPRLLPGPAALVTRESGPAEPRPVTDLDRPARPRWARPGLLAVLAATAVAYLYDLSASGYGNSFYAAAVQAGSKSWKAFLFGSLDSSNFITVDKPPAALWVMDLSARLFGFSTWSVMVPEVVEGILAVALLYGAVRRVAGDAAGLIAAATLALTPAAALMFRFDNPDAFLVLLLVASAYCLTRAVERAGTRWIVAAGALLGLAFLAKMLQAFTVLPAFGLVYLIAAPTTLRRRCAQLVVGLGALVVAGGWWVALVTLIPAADRPFVDGSPDNSILNLIFVYNGFGRLTGSGAGGGANFSGAAGPLRLFDDLMAGQASWLLPAALAMTVVILVGRRHAPRTDGVRAAAVLWAGWLVVTAVVFSYSKGIIHTYYTVALAPPIAALVAIGGQQLWANRRHIAARAFAAAVVTGTGAWSWTLLDRTPAWHPALRWIVVAATVAGTVGCLAGPSIRSAASGARRLVATVVLALVLLTGLGGPIAYAADTVASGHTGSIPSAGPTVSGAGGGFGGFGGGTRPGGAFPTGGATGAAGRGPSSGTRPTGTRPNGSSPFGGTPGTTGSSGSARSFSGHAFAGGGRSGGGATSAALVTALRADASRYRWVAATDGSQSAATLELATGDPVMAIGGFSGEGGNLSLAAFEAYVAKGDIHYYIAGGSAGPGGGGSSSSITTWVAAHYTARTVGGETVYDLTATGPSASS